MAWVPVSCAPSAGEQHIVRTMASLLAWRARWGKCSQTEMPGTSVAIGSNGPRTSAGASGFMSKVSIWLGPPVKKMNSTPLARGTLELPVPALVALRAWAANSGARAIDIAPQ